MRSSAMANTVVPASRHWSVVLYEYYVARYGDPDSEVDRSAIAPPGPPPGGSR